MDLYNARIVAVAFTMLALASIAIDWTKPVRALNLLVVGATTNLYFVAIVALVQQGANVNLGLKAQELAMAALFGWCFGTIVGCVRMYRDSRRQAAVEAKYAAQWEVDGVCAHVITVSNKCCRCGGWAETGLPWDGYTDDDGAYLDAICGDANPYENMMDRELAELLERKIEQARVISAHSGDMFALPVQVEIDAIYAEMRRRG
jgi:hypothetical protein